MKIGRTDELAAVFRALADPTRLRILVLLAQRGEMYQKRLVHAMGRDQSGVSRHLSYLKRRRLVLERQDGRFVYVRLGSLPADVFSTLAYFSKGADRGLPDPHA